MRVALIRWLIRAAWRLGYLPGCCSYHDPLLREER
jgi:hypothetical protein